MRLCGKTGNVCKPLFLPIINKAIYVTFNDSKFVLTFRYTTERMLFSKEEGEEDTHLAMTSNGKFTLKQARLLCFAYISLCFAYVKIKHLWYGEYFCHTKDV